MEVYHTDQRQEYLTDEGCHIVEVLNQSTYPKLSIAQARVEPGIVTQLHALSGTEEIYYILRGQGEANISGQIVLLAKGDCIIIKPDEPQSILNIGDVDLIFLCICQPRFEVRNYKALE